MAEAANSITRAECNCDWHGEKRKCSGCPATKPMCQAGVCVQPTCANVHRFCNDDSVAGVRARQLCPVYCGCADPLAPLALALPSSGCGDQCARSGVYLAARKRLPCEDMAVDDPVFIAFLDDWDRVRHGWPSDWNFGSNAYIEGLRRFGCRLLGSTATQEHVFNSNPSTVYPPFLSGTNVCVEGGFPYPVKPLSYICPVACGCHGVCSEIRIITQARPPWHVVELTACRFGAQRVMRTALMRALVETRPRPSARSRSLGHMLTQSCRAPAQCRKHSPRTASVLVRHSVLRDVM